MAVVSFVLIAFSLVAVSDGCSNDTDCESELNQVCCNSECVYGSSCIGQSCTSHFNCSSDEDESCCKGECRSDCLGSSCSNDSDCGIWETCCYGTCQYTYDGCYEPLSAGQLAAVIVSSIIGSFVFICVIVACICCSGRNETADDHSRVNVRGRITPTTVTTRRRAPQSTPPRQGHHDRVIVERRARATITITGCSIQNNPPHQGQVPPSDQQGYPFYPPPQYEQQQQTANLPTNIPKTMAASKQPPPYNRAPHERSGGVYAPKPSYGALQSAQVV